jgi:hypothetical protein
MEDLRQVHLSVEVHSTNHTPNAIYRLYADNDLLTERQWIWNSNTYITEKVHVHLPLGVHKIRLESVNCNDFSLDNFKINSVKEYFNRASKEIRFVVDASSPKVG